MNYLLDGKGNIWEASEKGTGRRLVWDGHPMTVLTLLQERDRLQAEVEHLLQLVEIGKEAARHGLVLAQEIEVLRDGIRNADTHR